MAEVGRSNQHVEALKDIALAEMEEVLRTVLGGLSEEVMSVVSAAFEEADKVESMGPLATSILKAKDGVVLALHRVIDQVEDWKSSSGFELDSNVFITVEESIRLQSEGRFVVLAHKIRQKAQMLGISAVDLASELGVDRSVMDRMLSGELPMTRDDLEKINFFFLKYQSSEGALSKRGESEIDFDSPKEVLKALVNDELNRDVNGALNRLRIGVLAASNAVLDQADSYSSALELATAVVEKREEILREIIQIEIVFCSQKFE